jgi:hypothetical protein
MFSFSGLGFGAPKVTLSPSSSLQDSLSPQPFLRPPMFSGQPHQSPGAFSFPQPTASPAPAQQQLHSHTQPQQLPQPHQSPGAFSFSQPAAPFGLFNFSTPQVVQSHFWNTSSVSQAAASSSSGTFAIRMPPPASPAPMQSLFGSQPQQQLHSHMQPQQLPQPHQSPGAFAYTYSFPQPTASPAPAQQQLHSHMQPQQLLQPHQSPGAFSFSQPAAPFGLFNFSTPQVVQSHFWNTSSVSHAAASSSSSPFVCSSFFSGISSQSQSQAIVSSSCSFGSASFSPDLGCYQTAQALPDPFKTPFSSPPHVPSSAADSCGASSSFSGFRLDDDDGNSDKGTSHYDQHEMINEFVHGGDAPGVDDRRSTSTEGQHSRASTISNGSNCALSSDPRLPTKQMKAASKPLQFFTTIVVKSCCWVKEHLGFVGATKRASTIFEKVECGLRDRVNYPLPPEVALKDLMAFSAFKWPDEESLYDAFCVSKTEPLKSNMIGAGEKWYNNKFTDIRKIIANRILPKFLNIVKTITGDGKKSG